jgi:predicted transcriptional regulator
VAETDTSAVELATELTIAWLGNSNTRVAADAVPAFLKTMVETVISLQGVGSNTAAVQEPKEYTPAISARKSLASKDHIISMNYGKPYKALRRHLATNGLTPAEYRERYGLKPDYPMVAESYSESRRAMAEKIGLGRKPSQRTADSESPSAKRGRKPTEAAAS